MKKKYLISYTMTGPGLKRFMYLTLKQGVVTMTPEERLAIFFSTNDVAEEYLGRFIESNEQFQTIRNQFKVVEAYL